MRGFNLKQTAGGIKEYTYKKNGLRVLLSQDCSSEVVGFMVTYHVGSRNEALGHTGATHLLEHLMFKGSTHFKQGHTDLSTILENKGALLNATTWFDRTNYYAVIRKENLETVIALEADRMRNASFNEKDRSDEMPIVRSEFEIGENDPTEALDKQIWASAYQAHPYHHSTIGWQSDIENVSIERLREFYDVYYWPNNATVTVVGNFDEKKALSIIKKHFGKHKKAPKSIPRMYTTEPKQEGRRHVIVKRAGNTNIIALAYKTPPALHPDMPVLQIIETILAEGRQSRFHKRFIDTGLASHLSVYSSPFLENGLFQNFLYLTNGTSHDKILKILEEEYMKLRKKVVLSTELKRAKAQLKSEVIFAQDGAYRLLSSLNEAIARGDWKYFTSFLQNVEKVRGADIIRVANKYFLDDQSTTGYFIGTNNHHG